MPGNDNKFNTLYKKVFDKNGNIKKMWKKCLY